MEISGSVLSKLGFDWQVAIANLVNFLIVYFLLKKVVFNKLRDVILERKAKTLEGVRLREEADHLHKETQKIKEMMKKEAAQERHEILVKAEKEKTFLLEKTAKEIQELKQKASNDALVEKQRIIKNAEGEIIDIAKSLTKKVLESYQEKPDMNKVDSLTKHIVHK